ncbi:hypothetical protein P3X46_007206 [Hevea brasiliensis]|uniref:VQ domain-containing protein n=2 Tax=Hevea brasiliensis TaxID=3981 RepID=A0ABQ9MTC0_HEVBR|nr:hypothetical protein P3X46_007206 [Hevea brasiliensis]
MSETIPSSSEWFPFHEQTSIHGQAETYSSSLGFSDATIVTTTTTTPIGASDHSLVLSPTCSTTATAPLTPKVCVSKTIRRRSRASKKTPTTLLNANTKNFRALVQQFTGCNSTTRSFGRQMGPINLNFQLGSAQNHNIETTIMSPFFGSYNNYPHQYHQYQMQQQEQQPLQQQHHDHQQSLHQEQKYMVSSLEDFYFRGPGDIGTTTAGNNLEIPDEILIMDDFPLYELARESLYNENMNVTSS